MPTVDMTTFAEALRWHMERHGHGVADVAAGAGVSLDTVKKLRSRPGSSTKAAPAARIAAFYGKSVPRFMACEDAAPDDAAAFEALVALLTEDERALLLRQIRGLLSSRPTTPKST